MSGRHQAIPARLRPLYRLEYKKMDSIRVLEYEGVWIQRPGSLPDRKTGNTMKISARNSLEGTIKDVTKGSTTAHVLIELKGGEIITASITNEAVDDLGLVKGKKAHAIIKSSDVIVAVS
jgi:molybdopterin-binding protein